MASVLWRRIDGTGVERCALETTADGHRIAGTVLLALDGAPHEIRYTVMVDQAWRTRTVGAHVQGPRGDRRLALSSDGEGSWSTADAPIIDLYGGESHETTFAVIDYPAHDIGRTTATYTRIAADTYEVMARGGTTTLVVEPDGLAITQPGTWEPVATG